MSTTPFHHPFDSNSATETQIPTPTANPDNPSAMDPSSPPITLRAFNNLPAYEFDFDYRAPSIRPQPRQPTHTHTIYPPPPMDDFDSYMFPDPASPYDQTESSLPSDTTSATHTSADPASAASTPPPPSLTPNIDWSAVHDARIFSPDGNALDPSTLYTGYTTHAVLIFVPRQSVELCALVYAKLAHLLQQASARLVFITPWTTQQAATFLSRFERVAPFPGAVVCDDNATLFTAFGFTRSPLRALFAPSRVSAPMRQGVRNAFSTVSYRAANRDIATTAVPSKRLKAGSVVLRCLRGYEKRPHILYAAEEVPSTGVGCYMDVLATCGVNEAFVPDIDVSQLYARFNSMRVTSMKARYADEKEANRLRANNKPRGSRKGDRRNALKT